jgi:hypothetical protein
MTDIIFESDDLKFCSSQTIAVRNYDHRKLAAAGNWKRSEIGNEANESRDSYK